VSPFVTTRGDLLVEVTGADRVSYLDDVTTQQLTGRAARTWTSALELDAHGAAVSAFDVVLLDDRLLLLAPTADAARDLVARLGARTFLADASFAPSSLVTVCLRGPGAPAVAEEAELGVACGRVEPRVGALVIGRDGGVDVLVEPADVDEVVNRLVEHGARRADPSVLDDWQVATGQPRWGHEIAPPHLPEELGLLASHVHLAKGCYPGQEAVARMWMLGRPRRQLARIRATGAVEAGWTAGEGRHRVQVTGVVDVDGDRVGLAFVPADSARGARYEGEGGATVEVIEVVGADRPGPGHDPNVTRRRDQRGA